MGGQLYETGLQQNVAVLIVKQIFTDLFKDFVRQLWWRPAICHTQSITWWLINLSNLAPPRASDRADTSKLLSTAALWLLLNTVRVCFSLKAETWFDRDTSVKPDSYSLQPQTNTHTHTYTLTAGHSLLQGMG